MQNGSSQSLFTFSFLVQQNFLNWIQQIVPSSKISSYICYVQCMYILWKTYFLHFARLVGTFLVCRRKLSELSSKVQIVWEGLKIWKKSTTYFWNDLLSKVKTKWVIFSKFYQDIWTLFKNVCSSQCSGVIFFLKSYCYFHASLLFHLLLYVIYSISIVRTFVKYLVKSKGENKYSVEFKASRSFQPHCELLQSTFGY